jgi:hypothetical protein
MLRANRKSKQKSVFLFFDFTDFTYIWISPELNFLGQQSKQKLFFVWISPRSQMLIRTKKTPKIGDKKDSTAH